MGVQNFWQLIESTGRPVNMNKGLEGKVLAIDISIWLHQAAKGMRDRQNPHIILLLHRICKLLHFKIKPIFIFDGGVPELKRRTLAERKQRRDVAATKATEAKNKIRTNYLKMLAIQQLKGEQIESIPPPPLMDEHEKDLFELPDTHLRSQLPDDEHDEDEDDEIIENTDMQPVTKVKPQRTTWSKKRPTDTSSYHYVLPNFDELDNSALNNLPAEMQHEILTDMKESLKRGHHQIENMPQKSDDFSDYQVQKLLKQNSVSQKISSLNKAIKRQKFGTELIFQHAVKHDFCSDISSESDARVYAGKLASDASTQYILIKSDTTPKDTSTTLSRLSSTSSLSSSFSRQSTSDFCADSMMNRDPVYGLIQRKSVTTEASNREPSPAREPSPLKERPIILDLSFDDDKKSPIKEPAVTSKMDEEEQHDLELAIKRSLDDQQQHEQSTTAKTDANDSSSDSDDSDFIDVPTIPISTEPIFPLHSPVDDSHNNTSSELIELDNDDESSHNSTAIEDIKMFIDIEKEESSVNVSDTQTPSTSQLESLEQLRTEIIDDTAAQLTAARGNERLTATLTDTMHEDTQYLLRLFGIPYLISPTEAEAQCAYLDLSKQCDGVITDDSDVWLFGASHVYRHFFRQNQLVEYYDTTIISNQSGLDREAMIAIGMIVGSDYTKGIPNAGIMTALEILQEFHGTCMERLEKFRRWWKKAQKPDYKTDSKVLKRLKNLELFEGFPNKAVYDAYVNPKIDYDQSKFTWAMPQLELIREFIGSKLKWDRRKIDEMILPVIKRMNTKAVQSRIDSFFAPYSFESTSHSIRKNTRLQAAFNILKQKTQEAKELDQEAILSDDDDDDDAPIPEKPQPKKRTRVKTTRLMDDVLGVMEKTKRRSKKKPTITSPRLSDDDTS
ncbi:unnamed protein product [Adineta ricciae]|uniref:Uncharacterized protein n=1 Tax=Adineta ricciae TaxID=249248 RepID=A0A814U689_ADIRI|nr:unnamed protein product [Adineta ricciae]